MRQPELLDRCKAVITWCVLGVVFVHTLDALEKDYAARVRHKQHDYHPSVRRLLVLDRCDDVISGCVLGIAVVRTLNSLERDYTARLRQNGRQAADTPAAPRISGIRCSHPMAMTCTPRLICRKRRMVRAAMSTPAAASPSGPARSSSSSRAEGT